MNKISSINIGMGNILSSGVYALFIREIPAGHMHRTYINITDSSLRRLLESTSYIYMLSLYHRHKAYD